MILIVYVIAVVLSFKNKSKLAGSYLKYLPYFLLFDFILSFVVYIMPKFFNLFNIWLINIVFNFELLFIFFLYYNLLKDIKYKKFTLISGIIYEVIFIIRCLMSKNYMLDYQEFSFFIGTLLAIIVLMLFVLDMLATDDFLFIHQYTVFWVTIAYLFYFIIPFPLSFWMHLFYYYGTEYLLDLSMAIQTVANLLMYLILIFGFIWSKKRYK